MSHAGRPECAQLDDAPGQPYALHALVPLRADLHDGSVRRGQLNVFDFDDRGPGPPVQDLANSAFSLWTRLGLEDAFAGGESACAVLAGDQGDGF